MCKYPVVAKISLLQVAAANSRILELIGDALTQIEPHIGRWECEAELFAKSPRVLRAITRLFIQIITLCIEAQVHFARSAFSRLVKASFTASFDTTVEALRKCASTLGQELWCAAEEGAKLDLYWLCEALC
jgi:hypothetical protein